MTLAAGYGQIARSAESYDSRADDFWHPQYDVGQNIAAQKISGHSLSRYSISAATGRDLKVFAELGHLATGLEGAGRFAAMACAHSGCEVWRQDFLKLDLPQGHFDGVFANAALFHLPSQELPRVLRELQATLKPDGILFCSNPHGQNQEGWNGGRYGTYYAPDTWLSLVAAAGFVELSHYFRPPGLPRAQQPWLASVWRKQTGA